MFQENHQPDISNIMKNPMKPPCSYGFSYGFPMVFLWFSHSNNTQTPSESPMFSAISAGPLLAGLADGVQGLGEGGEIPGGHRPFQKGAVSIGFLEKNMYIIAVPLVNIKIDGIYGCE